MKRLIVILCAALMVWILASASSAEPELAPMLDVGVVTAIPTGCAVYDLDGDGTAEQIDLVTTPDEYGDNVAYSLSVNSQTFSGDGWWFDEELYALRLNEYSGTLLLVYDNGPSDDPFTQFYLYETGLLMPAGSIASSPYSMRVENGIITATVRGRVLHTWYHDADFSMARSFSYDAEGNPLLSAPVMYPIPRFTYPMGLIVTLKVDLPLQMSMNDGQIAATLSAGSRAVLCASDDVQWVYIQSADSHEGGWMKLVGEYSEKCLVGDIPMDSFDVFDGLFFAG